MLVSVQENLSFRIRMSCMSAEHRGRGEGHPHAMPHHSPYAIPPPAAYVRNVDFSNTKNRTQLVDGAIHPIVKDTGAALPEGILDMSGQAKRTG